MKRSGLFLSALILALSARADEVHLKSGGKLEGLARRDGDQVVIETMGGEIVVAAAEVASINERHTSDLETYRAKLEEAQTSKDPAVSLSLALWAKEHRGSRFVLANLERAIQLGGAMEDSKALYALMEPFKDKLGTELRPLWDRLVHLDPEHEVARRALGFRRRDGVWLSEEEFQSAMGNVLYDGKWVSPEERALIVRARELRLEEQAVEFKEREKKLASAEEKLAQDRKIQDALQTALAEQRVELAKREEVVRAQEAVLQSLRDCQLCGSRYTGFHLCPRLWHLCGTCGGYFRGAHACGR